MAEASRAEEEAEKRTLKPINTEHLAEFMTGWATTTMTDENTLHWLEELVSSTM